MSLIITNETTLKDKALIVLSNKQGEITEENIGDITLIKIEDQTVGINVFNYKKYFSAKSGAHTINNEQVKAIEELGFKIESSKSMFSIGEVIEKETHPKSDRLFVLKVKTDKVLQIVTNAANAEIGKKVVVANVGATLPSGLPIIFSKVMGVESEGMLCGGQTLGLEPTEGIYHPNGNVGDEYIL